MLWSNKCPSYFPNVHDKGLKGTKLENSFYIDDILVFSKNFDEHLIHLNQVFQKLREANLTLQPTKCHFASKQVKYLGHIILKMEFR